MQFRSSKTGKLGVLWGVGKKKPSDVHFMVRTRILVNKSDLNFVLGGMGKGKISLKLCLWVRIAG